MRITDLEILGLGTAQGDSLFVKLHGDDGQTGLAEARLSCRTETLPAFLRSIAPRVVLGADPFETERLVARLVHAEGGRVDRLTATAASLLEVACWDLVGKALGVPVYRLLGGAVRDRIKAYASGWQPADPAPQAVATAARQVVARGYRALSFDPFARPGRQEPSREEIHAAARRAELVRAAVGPDVEILIELRGRFTPATAIRVARLLERMEPAWVADPVATDHARVLAAVGKRTKLSVAAGGRGRHRLDYLEILTLQACDVLQPDLSSCCGLLEARKMAAMAEAYAIALAPRQAGGLAAAAASLHLCASLPNVLMLEASHDFADDEPLEGGPNAGRSGNLAREAVWGCPEVVGGEFLLPQGPGLGIRLDEDVLRAHPPRTSRPGVAAPR